MRIITKKQELKILKRIYANHKIANAEIKDPECLMYYLDNEVGIVARALGIKRLNAMARLIEKEIEEME